MPEREDNDEALLLLLLAFRRLITQRWMGFYLRTEKRGGTLRRRVETEARRTERRARLAYQGQIASLDVDDGVGATRLMAPAARAVVAERMLRGEIMRSMSEGGAIHRKTLTEMRQLHREGIDQVAAQIDELEHVATMTGLKEPQAALQTAAQGARATRGAQVDSWAMRRDLELLADRTAHRAALSMHAAFQGQRLSQALKEASAATKINRKSLSNSTVGSARASLRRGVYLAAGGAAVFGKWYGVRPYPGGAAAVTAHTEDDWIRSAASATRGDAWRPGNPVSGWGLHVGSRTFFAPELDTGLLTKLAAGLAVTRPELTSDLKVNEPVSILTVGSPPVEYAGQGVYSVNELLSAMAAQVTEERRHLPDIPRTPSGRIRADIVGVFGKGPTRLYAIDAGRNQGVQLGQRFEVYNALGPTRGARKSVIAITGLYPETAVGFVAVYDSLLPELLDRVALG